MYRWVSIAMLALVMAAGCGEKGTAPDPMTPAGTPTAAIPDGVQKLLDTYAVEDDAALVTEAGEWKYPTTVDPVDTGYDVYAVTFVWGGLPRPNVAATDPIDWTGDLSVNGVAIIDVLFPICFEPQQDKILPRTERAKVEWISQTNGDFDGLAFLVFLKRDVVYIMAPVLTFRTPQITISLDFGQLAKYMAYYPVSNGTGVAVCSRKLGFPLCPGGLIDGLWIKAANAGDSGTIAGLWKSRNGVPIGHIVGTFWKAEDGTREFSGWVTGYYLDVILAEFKGTWGYDDYRMCPLCGEGHGWFRGLYVDKIDGGGGRLRGVFGDFNLPVELRGMPMVGVWQRACRFDDATPDGPGN